MSRGLVTPLKIRALIVKKRSLNVRGKSTGRPRLVTERNRRLLVKICKAQRRSTLREITSSWNQQNGLNFGRECFRKWILKSGLSFYKI